MIVKPITYVDFNGEKRTEEHCFHLSKIERLRLDSRYEGGLQNWIASQIKVKTIAPILALIEEIIQTAHGKKSEDGKRFEKNPEFTMDFVESEAYSELVMSLLTGEDAVEKTTAFIEGVVGEHA